MVKRLYYLWLCKFKAKVLKSSCKVFSVVGRGLHKGDSRSLFPLSFPTPWESAPFSESTLHMKIIFLILVHCTGYIIFWYKNCRLWCTKMLVIFFILHYRINYDKNRLSLKVFLIFFKDLFCTGFAKYRRKMVQYLSCAVCMCSYYSLVQL